MGFLYKFLFASAVVAWAVGGAGGRLVDDYNFCDADDACRGSCKKLHSGFTKFRLPSWTTGHCLNDTAMPAGRYCQCRYNGVNVPCETSAGGNCPPSNASASTNYCDPRARDEACTLGCRASYMRLSLRNDQVKGSCEDAWMAPSLWTPESVHKSYCICHFNDYRMN